jgi:predicted acyltransferase
MIFPSFLFIVGVAITLSLSSRIARGDDRRKIAGRALVRSVLLFGFGLIMTAFPDFDLHTMRPMGIFQRIAVCYLCGSLLYLGTAGQSQAGEADHRAGRVALFSGIIVCILAGYWALLKLVPVPGVGAGHLDSFGNLPAYLDRRIIGVSHMWIYGVTAGMGVTYDPEGILSTLPALSNVLFGMLAGEWMRTRRSGPQKAAVLAAAGLALVLAGWFLHPMLPLNKKIWTSTFALFSTGVAMMVYALLYTIVDLWRSRWWTPPAMIFGTNAMLAFALSGVLTTLGNRHLSVPHGGGTSVISIRNSVYRHCFASWLAPVHASLAYAIAVVVLDMLLIYPLYRKRIFLKL